MDYRVSKSGLEIFDTVRAYGLAQVLLVLADGKASPRISDEGGTFLLSLSTTPSPAALRTSDSWRAVFAANNWQRVFLTYKNAWSSQRDKVKKSLESHLADILAKAKTDGLAIDLRGEFALPGSLDPVGFKGLKGLTAGNYSEGQTMVDEFNWAIGCLGATVAQRYKIQKAKGNKWEYYVTLPVPEKLRFDNFLSIRQLVYDKGLGYNGIRNAAAHFSLLLADTVREKAQGNPYFPARFSNVLYFSLFQSGQQFKPSIGGAVNIAGLIEMALSRPEAAHDVFKTWDYLFRRGSGQGNEDLAQAITDLILAPSLETYYRHARIFNRYIVDRNKGVKQEHLYTDKALKEVMCHVQ